MYGTAQSDFGRSSSWFRIDATAIATNSPFFVTVRRWVVSTLDRHLEEFKESVIQHKYMVMSWALQRPKEASTERVRPNLSRVIPHESVDWSVHRMRNYARRGNLF